jgi:hypothetical protein
MTDVSQIIDQQIETLETALKNDPRFRQLAAWRAVRAEYEALDAPNQPQQIAAAEPERTRQKRKYTRKTAKPVKAPRATRPAQTKSKAKKATVRKTAPASSGASPHDEAVLKAIIALQEREMPPGYHAIRKITKISNDAPVRAAIVRLTNAGRITGEGGPRNRTYIVHGKVKPRSARVDIEEPEPEIEQDGAVIVDEPEIQDGPEEVEDETLPPVRSAAQPRPDSFDLASLNRSERKVLMACLASGDNMPAAKIALFADVLEDRVPLILMGLNSKCLTSHTHGKWSLTDLGHSAAVAMKSLDKAAA